jgi:hypothetical protein
MPVREFETVYRGCTLKVISREHDGRWTAQGSLRFPKTTHVPVKWLDLAAQFESAEEALKSAQRWAFAEIQNALLDA